MDTFAGWLPRSLPRDLGAFIMLSGEGPIEDTCIDGTGCRAEFSGTGRSIAAGLWRRS